ncbi:hypothetical protein OG585_53375 (plasmid) [Streptomyces sp. NBC_01340]|nr:hypothetical protein OG585_53375 [Streptomyces sp. NBC_01340]
MTPPRTQRGGPDSDPNYASATIGLRPEETGARGALVTMPTQIGSVAGIGIPIVMLATASGEASLKTYRHAWPVMTARTAAAARVSRGVSQKRAVPVR